MSNRVLLRPHTLESLEPLCRWQRDAEILANSSDDVCPMDEAAVAASLERWMQPRDDIQHFAIALLRTNRPIGFLHVAFIDAVHRRCKLGFVIGEKELWGQGYGREALGLAIEHCFATLNMNRIGAEVYATNVRSIRLLERAGFVREGVLRENLLRGRFIDELQYGLLRREWAGRGGIRGSLPI